MADLDNLQIQITASSSQAKQAIDALKTSLTNLNSSLSNLKSLSQTAEGLEALANGLNHISQATDTIDANKIKDISKAINSLSKAGSKLSIGGNINKEVANAEKRLNSLKEGKTSGDLSDNQSGIKSLASVNPTSLTAVAQALQQIKSVGTMPDFSSVGILTSNINKLSGEGAGKLSTTLPQIAQGLRAFQGLTIPNFPNMEVFVTGLKELSKMSGESASKAGSNLVLIAQGLRDFNGVVIPDLGNIEGFVKSLRSLGSKGIVNASTSLAPIADALRQFEGIQVPNVEGISQFAEAIGRFGYKSSTQAIENIPRLAQAFNQLVTSINQGNITERTVQFAQAMGQVAQSCGRTSGAIRTVHKQTLNWSNLIALIGAKTRQFNVGALKLLMNGLKKVGTLFMQTASKVKTFTMSFLGIKRTTEEVGSSFDRLAQKIGKFWASAFWIITALRGLWSSVKSSMDYIETLNYFKASFRQVSSTAVGSWEKLGYDSAEAYADSFEKRAKQLTSKMTGFNIEDNGELTMSSGKTLGMNPNTLMQYQAQFAQMASSMGASANNATLLSQALIEIGADLASVKNLKFEDVFGDMASGLVGMSRTLDKYGVNIRKSAMNQKLLELGIDTTVDKLSGADKAMLRTIILLDSTKYAWGDLANTINQPANQLRLLTANLQNCARMLGNLFLPIVAKVLPYLNAMAIAVQRLLTYLAKLFGIDLGKITSGVGASNEAISDLLDDAEGVDDALDDASESAKKLKNNLLGVDELNIVSDNLSNTDVNGNKASILDDAFLDALGDYQSVWDQAFDAMENRAKELADKIVQFFKDLFKPITDAWANVGDKVKDAWAKAFKSLGELAKSIFSDIWEVWQSPLNTKIFENLFLVLADIGEIVSHLADNFRRAWDESDRGKHILESIQKIIWAFTENLRELADYTVTWAKNLDFTPLLSSIDGLLQVLADNSYDIFGIWQDWYTKVILPLGKYLIEEFFPKAIDSVTRMLDKIDFPKLRKDLGDIFESLEGIAELVGGVLLTAFDKLTSTIGKGLNPFIESLAKSFKNLYQELKNSKDVNDVIDAIFNFGDDRAVDLGKLVHSISKKLNEAFDKIDFKEVGRRLAGMLNKFLAEVDVNELAKTLAGIVNSLFDIVLGFIEKLNWFKIGQLIGDFLREIDWLKILEGVFAIIGGFIKAKLGMWLSAPLETGIVTLFTGGWITSAISKALTGKGLFTNIFEKLLGLDDTSKMTKALENVFKIDGETTAFDRLKKSAENASGAKDGFRTANEKLGAGAEVSAGKIAGEMTALDKLKVVAKTVATEIAGIALVAGGSYLGITNFIKQLQDGFSWANEALMLLGIAMATVGAIILGAPAVVAGVVGAVVAVVATAIVLIKEHWEEIKQWVAGLGEWLTTHIGEPVKKFFTETIPNAFSAFGEWISGVCDSVKEKLGAFRDKVHELAESVSMKLADNAQKVGQWVSDVAQKVGEFFTNLWQNITDWLGKIWEHIKTALGSLFETIGEFFTRIWDSVSTFFTNLWDKITGFFSEIWTRITEFFANVWDSLSSFVANTWESIRSLAENIWNAIKNVIDAILGWLAELWEHISSFIGKVVSAIVNFVADVWSKITAFLSEVWQGVSKFFSDVWQGLVKFVEDTIGKVKTFFEDVWSKVKTFFKDTVEHIKERFSEIIEKVKTFFADIWQKIKDFFVNAWDTIKTKIGDIITGAWNLIKGLPEKLWNFGKNLLEGFIGGFKSKVSDTWSTISEWGSGIIDKAKSIFGIHSPSKEFYDIAKYDIEGYTSGVDNEKQKSLDALSNFAKEAVKTFDGVDKQFNDIGTNAGKSLADGIKNATSLAMDSVRSMVNQILTFVRESMGQVNTLVMQAINNLTMQLNNLIVRIQQAQAQIASMGGMTYTYGNIMDYYDDNGIRYFASGGFPEDGWFRASHGEMIGRFDNGQSVVANNQQITEGISRAVYDAIVSAGMGGGREEELLEELIQAVKNGQHISIDGRELVNAYDNRKARNGYAFT